MRRTAPPRPLGAPLAFTAPAPPEPIEHRGEDVLLRPIDPATDAAALYALTHGPSGDSSIWDYLPEGPFPDLAAYRRHVETQAASVDPLFFTVAAGADFREPSGVLSYLSIVPEHGRIEIGHIWFGSQLQRTPAATEAIFLLARHAFDELGYRRLEWKCNALNGPSRGAALRFGFLYEGTFAQHQVVKGRNRDTAWFAITDRRWPRLRAAFEQWLAPENFDAGGRQRLSLRELTSAV